MTYLLDTHALVWWLEGSDRLSAPARDAIGDPTARILVSAASAWEIATKVRLGKLPGVAAVVGELPRIVASQGFEPLPVSFEDGEAAGRLPGPHRDPFDRMLIAQSLGRDVPLVSLERAFDAYGVHRVW